MKLISFAVDAKNYKSFGLVTASGIVDLGLKTGNIGIKSILTPEKLSALRVQQFDRVDYALEEVRFLPVIEQPGKILGWGMNYAEKRQEFNHTATTPIVFIRFADSQTAHNDVLIKPKESDQFDYEGELAVIIGKSGRNIEKSEAYEYVAGYSCYIDGSARDWQNSSITAGKNWPKTGAFGPYLVTTDEIPDPHKLTIKTVLNEQTVQDDRTDNMIYTIPDMLAFLSSFTELNPGDVILTGSPGGVGKSRTPPLFLKENDVLRVEIESVGVLINKVVQV